MDMLKFDDRLYRAAQFNRRPKKIYRAYAQAVYNTFQPNQITSVLDLGCANGYALEWWQKQEWQIRGAEAAPAAFRYMPSTVRPLVKKQDLRINYQFGQFDLVNCSEVGEHIEAKYESALLKNIVSSVKRFLVISWSNDPASAEHVNPRPGFYLKIRLRRLGLYFEPELTGQLKAKLITAAFSGWNHWAKNILVFSRTPSSRRILIRHYQWLPSYANKNIGYFMSACQRRGYSPRWGMGLMGHWHRVWLYPFEKHLLLKLLILKFGGNKVIFKLDSQILPRWRAALIECLVFRVLAESEEVAKPFRNSQKLVYFSGGLPQKNINLINRLKIKRQKIILYAGRPVWQKGYDRLKKIIPSGWKLRIATDLPPSQYYREILAASVVVLPTRGEGWPNVFQDAFYCRRLFLTTKGARCGEAIKDKTFYCHNSIKGLKTALKKITTNIDAYYRDFNALYNPQYFQTTDGIFDALVK